MEQRLKQTIVDNAYRGIDTVVLVQLRAFASSMVRLAKCDAGDTARDCAFQASQHTSNRGELS